MGVRNQQGSPPGVSGQHSCRPAPVSKPTRELARLLANIRTTLLQSENWFAGVGNKQGNSSFRKQSGYLPYQEADLEGTGGKRENGRFWQHSGNPLFYYNFILFCSVFISF
jgi:hypothetical protein